MGRVASVREYSQLLPASCQPGSCSEMVASRVLLSRTPHCTAPALRRAQPGPDPTRPNAAQPDPTRPKPNRPAFLVGTARPRPRPRECRGQVARGAGHSTPLPSPPRLVEQIQTKAPIWLGAGALQTKRGTF